MSDQEFEAGLEHIRRSPTDKGVVKLIVRRPEVGARETLQEGKLDLVEGLVGDSWKNRGSTRTPDGSPNPNSQITIMNARVIQLLAQDEDRWQLAGDQLYIDLDLSTANLPPWTRLAVGSAVIQITDSPHTGCAKFASRFGKQAITFVNSDLGKQLRLRGVNAKVLQPGVIRVGDVATRITG